MREERTKGTEAVLEAAWAKVHTDAQGGAHEGNGMVTRIVTRMGKKSWGCSHYACEWHCVN